MSPRNDIEPGSLALPPETSPYPEGAMAVAYCDGASRGNPGPAAYGCAYVLVDGMALCGESRAIGRATNNIAEYQGLLAALRRLAGWVVQEAIVRLDSELVVRQMNGEYRVRNEGLKPLHAEARELASRFASIRFEHVRRAENALADGLANLALDRAATRG